MITPTWEELDAHPDRFEEWPPSGTVLAEPKPPEEPPPDEPHQSAFTPLGGARAAAHQH